MRNIFLLISNLFKVTFRKKGNIIVYILLPVASVLLSLMIYNTVGSSVMQIGYIDHDNTSISRDTIEGLGTVNGYKVAEVKEEDAKEMLLANKVYAVVIIPEGYEESIHNGVTKKIEIMSVKGFDTTVWIENYLNLHSRNLSDLSVASSGDKEAFNMMYDNYKRNKLSVSEIKISDERTGKEMTVTSLGFLIMFVMLGAGFTTQLILKEKRERTFYRIASSPVKISEYILSHIITCLLIELIQITVVIIFLEYVFRIKSFVPPQIMFIILFAFALVACGISLLVTSFSSSSYMASTMNTLIVTPSCMLGGCFWPVYLMPKFMQNISYLTPQRWALSAVDKIQKGFNFDKILINIIVLILYSAVFFAIAGLRLRKLKSVEKFV